MTELITIATDPAQVKQAVAEYSSQADQRTQALYTRFQEYNQIYWGLALPQAVIAIMPEMHNKKLAHYTSINGYQIPHAIEFNLNFIALNWGKEIVETHESDERTIVDHVLAHEMIHLYLQAVCGETYKDDQAAHGKSFRAEAARIGVSGKGRLMACPYSVNMPHPGRDKQNRKKELEQAQPPPAAPDDDDDQAESESESELTPRQLVKLLQAQAQARLEPEQLKQFDKALATAAAILAGEPAPPD